MGLANVQLPPRSHANFAALRSNDLWTITAVVFPHSVLERRSDGPESQFIQAGVSPRRR